MGSTHVMLTSDTWASLCKFAITSINFFGVAGFVVTENVTAVSVEVSAPITTDIGRFSPSDAQFLTEIRVAVHDAILVYEEQSVVPKNT